MNYCQLWQDGEKNKVKDSKSSTFFLEYASPDAVTSCGR